MKSCIREGARTLKQVGMACGAGTDCGACRGVLRDLLEEHGEEHEHVHLPMVAPA
ncbi:MAG: (2Fe-2S)-binding protein [Polyangiaceae bacterium]|nr:(2Fe-2S)-binding protein [Polyangiaceae bacterium]